MCTDTARLHSLRTHLHAGEQKPFSTINHLTGFHYQQTANTSIMDEVTEQFDESVSVQLPICYGMSCAHRG